MEVSECRTGQTFQELHQWIDEPRKWLKYNHRIERHSYTKDYEDYIKEKWGGKAVIEWLFHIALDNLETAHKFAIKTYPSSYDEITISFKGDNIDDCQFTKIYPNSKKFTRVKNYKKGESFFSINR
ncbi:MAG: hypothetical protein AABX00_00320 [Nanoarchaeota archaeon]